MLILPFPYLTWRQVIVLRQATGSSLRILSYVFIFCCTWLWWALKYGDWLGDHTFGLFILFSLFTWIYCKAKLLLYITSVGPVYSACIWYQYWYQHWYQGPYQSNMSEAIPALYLYQPGRVLGSHQPSTSLIPVSKSCIYLLHTSQKSVLEPIPRHTGMNFF